MSSPEWHKDLLFLANGNINPDVVTPATLRIFEESLNATRQTCWDSVRTPHLFMALMVVPDESIRVWAERAELDPVFVLAQFKRLFSSPRQEAPEILRMNREFLSLNVIRLLRASLERCHDQGRERILPVDLLIPILQGPNSVVAECFDSRGISSNRLLTLAFLSESLVTGHG